MKKLLFLLAFLPNFLFAEDIGVLNEKKYEIKSKISVLNEKKNTLKSQISLLERELLKKDLKKKKIFKELEKIKQSFLEKNKEKTENIFFKEIYEKDFGDFVKKIWIYENIENLEKNIFKKDLNSGTFLDEILNLSKKIILGFEKQKNNKIGDLEIISTKKQKILFLEGKIKEEIRNFVEIKEAKKYLLTLTKGQENIFQKKLEENKKEILYSLLEMKKSFLKQGFYEKKISNFEEKNKKIDIYDIKRFGKDASFFSWPVDKDRGFTAHFKDAKYFTKFGVEHFGLDIRAKQGTEVLAIKNAFVYKVVNGGQTGYSYVILAHKGAFQSLYGHLSKIGVKEGEIILKGQKIGLSGGMPGTNGAGLLTNGPHLHLEIHKNGKAINPLEVLK